MRNIDQQAYDELSLYTLASRDPYFIHQCIVDAYAAQHADDNPKPIKNAFALAGLYLMLEKEYTGKQVQDAHVRMSNHRKDWPHFSTPAKKATLTVHDALKTPPGSERDAMIRKWCAEVWSIWEGDHARVADMVGAALFQVQE